MIIARKNELRTFAFLVISVLILGILGSVVELRPISNLPPSASVSANAVTIKTLSAANKLVKQGAVRGIDVSKYQGAINWAQVGNSDIKFAFLRASIGLRTDEYFLANAAGANKNGIKVGAYHFATFRTTAEARQEANFFVSELDKVKITFPVVLDIEGQGQKGISAANLTTMSLEFMKIVEKAGYEVMIYSYQNFFTGHLNVSKFSNYDLWVANYIGVPEGLNYEIWQHTAAGSVPGIAGSVDIDIAIGRMAERAGGKAVVNNAGGSGNSSLQVSNVSVGQPTAAVKKKVVISKSISNSVKETLNERYGARIDISELNMTQINQAIASGLEYEISRQWGVAIPNSGTIDRTEIPYLSSVNWTLNKTNGNITYLLQSKLIYRGYFVDYPTSVYDNATYNAIIEFQSDNNLPATGVFDSATLSLLF